MEVLLAQGQDRPEPSLVARVADALRAGGVAVLPTDSVYGICCAAAPKNPAHERIFEVKRRDLHFGAGHPFRAPGHIPELSDEQLAEKLKEGRAELFNLRFQMATSQLDNTARVKTVKKDIARVLTEQRAREIAAEKSAAAE